MTPEVSILKALLSRDVYNKYYPYIYEYFKGNRELSIIINSITNIYNIYNVETISLEELSLDVKTKHNDSSVLNILSRLESISVSVEHIEDLLKQIKNKALAHELAVICMDITDGKKEVEDIYKQIEKFEQGSVIDQLEDKFVSTDLEELYEHTVKQQGLRWRLSTLNRMLGSLRKGDFGFLFARPESFSRDTEVLTPEGWLPVDMVTENTYIAQVNSNLTSSFVKPTAIHPHEQTHCFHIHDTLGRVDLIVTEGHGMIYEKNGKLWKERADCVKYGQGIKHHVSAEASSIGEMEFLPEHRLAIAYQADGHTRNYKDYGYTFSFKNERKQQRLREILDKCGYEYSEYNDGNRGHKGFYVKSKTRLYKDFNWVDLSKVSKHWCQLFIEELSYWDSTRRTDSRFKFDTTNKSVADKVQAIAILAGYNCLLSSHIDNRSPKYSDIYSLSIRTNYQPVDGQCIIKERIPYSDTTYCFEVPSGMLLVRRNGAVAVSGNTGKTTFLASEITYFASQTERNILWFN